MNKLRIAFDLDGVLIQTHKVWLERYNQEYGSEKRLTYDEITDWDMTRFVAPSCGKRIYSFLRAHDFYTYAPPIEGAVDYCRSIMDAGHEVWFVTSGAHLGKYEWLERHGLTTLADGGVKATNIITIDNKAFLVPLFDLLVDDCAETCLAWERAGGTAVLFDQPWNQWCSANIRRARTWGSIQAWVNMLSQ